MTLTATEITNSTASAFDVELTFYAGPTFASLTLSAYDYGVLPTLTGWTNVSAYVNYAGRLTYTRAGSSLRWTATLSGTGYNAAYFGPGRAILCLRRITVAGVQTVAQGLFFLGQIVSGSHEDDYRHGGDWQRNVSGLDGYLQRSTAPRLTAGRIDLLESASVTASSTLLTPALEAGSGDFAGTLVSVAATNTIDGNINTLWISNDQPDSTPEAAAPSPVQQVMIDKVFFKPIAGYDADLLWWIEIYATLGIADGGWYLRTSTDKILDFRTGPDHDIPVNGRAIICSSQADFEAYTGGAPGVVWIMETKSYPGTQGRYGPATPFTFDYNSDSLEIFKEGVTSDTRYESVAWSLNGDVPADTGGWTGDAINISGLPAGSGIRRKPTGNKKAGTNSSYLDVYGDPFFVFTDNLVPGSSYTEAVQEWLLFTLEGQTAVLAADASAGAGTITLSSTLGFPDIGGAVCDGDAFTYNGRTETTLTNVLGILAHTTGAAVYPTLGGVQQTGMPCRQVEILRKDGQSLIQTGWLYFKSTGVLAPKTPPEENYHLDYDGPRLAVRAAVNSVTDGIRDQGFSLGYTDGFTGAFMPRWVHHMLLVIDDMSDAGRAKVNDVKLYVNQTQIDYSGLGNIDTLTAGALANYIFGLAQTTASFTQSALANRLIGEHATAIAPYPQVLDDLARITGCCIDWGLDGNATWANDMWWHSGFPTAQQTPYAWLDARYLRDTVQYSGQKPNETYVRIHARTPDGKRQYQATYPLSGVTAAQQGIEYSDLICTTVTDVNLLAETLYCKAGLHYETGPQEASFTVKGVGEWLRPDMWVIIMCNNDTGETGLSTLGGGVWDAVSWLLEEVTWEWGSNGPFRTWRATARGRRYWR